ncbi:bifunctional serine/threonine-protein kinase/formylglycine-generating enzyme family protein [Microbulbifer sp. OS29]|uniref:Bifunctional serine/threonine-protein kinase/formylglycine-generating enzyme family protein n=1 Tax=Microbulbifer okhotskensis TaxID=2926617 RepID=A0A9X2EJN9_9GAMM|nr:bifunctional serine/threonine-protein kinase/formylglycine-generating enzyme family protein [Microbulbifer okhotskensis]MCO1332919.1 bifunctional serine/threonine-protein kinase/formylglycine-generating enzyme family protein [Microbulbifer okhotskensis]
MNDKTRIVRPSGTPPGPDQSKNGLTEDGDITVVVQQDKTGANDHPSIKGAEPVKGTQPVIPTAAANFGSDATVFSPGLKKTQEQSGQNGLLGGVPVSPGVPSEPSAPSELSEPVGSNAVTKTVIKGRFELDKLLGVGGMGAVYKALDRRKLEASDNEPYVAIKLLNDDFQKHPDAFISLQREARKSQTLAHPNIVTVYDFDRDGDRVFMTMEFLEGAPLDKLLRDHVDVGLEPERARSVLWDISQALIYAHSHKIVHSDFKPGNIFVTNKKGTKVFDFGIARAVSEGGIANKAGETTLFDAGTLGALTPAYASLEMLKGAEPAPSDDVFALGCVAYELFCGRHPYNKTPADKALEQGLRPRRIKGLNRRQWRSLESALELKRDNRTDTVDKFVQAFFVSNTWKWLLGSAFVMVLGGAVAGYSHLQQQNTVEQERVRVELERKHEQDLLVRRIADKKEAITRLIGLSILTPAWADDLQLELTEYSKLNPEDTEFQDNSRRQVSELFLAAATGQLNLGNLDQADVMLKGVATWYGESSEAAAIKSQLATDRENLRARLEAERITEEREVERIRLAEERAERRRLAAQKQRLIDAVLDDMETALTCSFSMNATAVGSQLARLAKLDRAKALKIRPVVGGELVNCASSLGTKDPLQTEILVDQFRALLPAYQPLRDFKLDFCGHLVPGSGRRGDRYTCHDRLADGSKGPAMVVIKGLSGRPLAVGKYEVSSTELAQFCRIAGQCEEETPTASDLPVNNVSLATAESYLSWLSDETGYRYRLPSEQEWFAAASARGEGEVADRNCHLKYGGIEKGGELVPVRAGSSNGLGLLNAVGNVQEWGLGTDGELLALGGSRIDPMSRCLATTKKLHNGQPDEFTGFRIVRDVN